MQIPPNAATATATAEPMDAPVTALDLAPAETVSGAALWRLAAWASGTFPTGAFAMSHGLEWAVDRRQVTSADTLVDWAGGIIAHGSGRADAILAAHAWRAASGRPGPPLTEIAELAEALAPSAERLTETRDLGRAFASAVAGGWGVPCDPLPYPVAHGAAAARAGLPLEPSLTALLLGTAQMIVAAGIRLIPIGLTEGQRVLSRLEPTAIATAQASATLSLDDIGSACYASDIASMAHAAQQPRLFRT